MKRRGSPQLPVVVLGYSNDFRTSHSTLKSVDQEMRSLQRELERGGSGTEARILPAIRPGDLADCVEDERFRDRICIFHYAGHASARNLGMQGKHGKAAAFKAAGIAALVRGSAGLRLVFLNACDTQLQAKHWFRAGVPAVLVTNGGVGDKSAFQFAERFYRSLAAGRPLQEAYETACAILQAGPSSQRGRWNLLWNPDANIARRAREWNLAALTSDWLWDLVSPPPRPLPVCPFVGLQPFTEEHAEVFFGRGRALRMIYDYAIASDGRAAGAILLYGGVGVGKSSLVAAGLMPRLRAKGIHPIYLRRDRAIGMAESLRQALAQAAGPSSPLEETSWRALWQAAEKSLGSCVTVVLDQAEEMWTLPASEAELELEQVKALLKSLFHGADAPSRPQGKLIIGFRKEWLSEMEKLVSLSGVKVEKVFLEPLDEEGIVEAIVGPRQVGYSVEIDEDLPALIANDLRADDSPLAPTLQILLTRLWAEAEKSDRSRPNLTRALYDRLKEEGTHLSDYLQQQIATLGTIHPAETQSGLVLDILFAHTTPRGTAGQCLRSQLDSRYGERVHPVISTAKSLFLLSDCDLKVDAPPAEDSKSSLSHDALAPLVRQLHAESDLPGQRARRLLDARVLELRAGLKGDGNTEADARSYVEQHPDECALDETSFAVVEAGLRGTHAPSEVEGAILEVSRQQSRKRQAEKQHDRQLRKLLVALLIIFGTAATVGWLRAHSANTGKEKTNKELSAANAEKETTNKALVTANTEKENQKSTALRRLSESHYNNAQILLSLENEADALAHLAAALEIWPGNRLAADRLFLLLTQREFAVPLYGPFETTPVRSPPLPADFVVMPDGDLRVLRVAWAIGYVLERVSVDTPFGNKNSVGQPIDLSPEGQTFLKQLHGGRFGARGDTVVGWTELDGKPRLGAIDLARNGHLELCEAPGEVVAWAPDLTARGAVGIAIAGENDYSLFYWNFGDGPPVTMTQLLPKDDLSVSNPRDDAILLGADVCADGYFVLLKAYQRDFSAWRARPDLNKIERIDTPKPKEDTGLSIELSRDPVGQQFIVQHREVVKSEFPGEFFALTPTGYTRRTEFAIPGDGSGNSSRPVFTELKVIPATRELFAIDRKTPGPDAPETGFLRITVPTTKDREVLQSRRGPVWLSLGDFWKTTWDTRFIAIGKVKESHDEGKMLASSWSVADLRFGRALPEGREALEADESYGVTPNMRGTALDHLPDGTELWWHAEATNTTIAHRFRIKRPSAPDVPLKMFSLLFDEHQSSHICGALSSSGRLAAIYTEIERDKKGLVVFDAHTGQQLSNPIFCSSPHRIRFSDEEAIIAILTYHDDSGQSTEKGGWKLFDWKNGHSFSEFVKFPTKWGSMAFVEKGGKLRRLDPDTSGWFFDISFGSDAGDVPAEICRLAQAIAGRKMVQNGAIVGWETVEAEPRVIAFQKLREHWKQQLSQQPNDVYARLGSWFLADRHNRTISPYSNVTIDEHFSKLLKFELFDEAELLIMADKDRIQRFREAKAKARP
jgi:hypothetical protein